jgi:leucyl aminopeptidase
VLVSATTGDPAATDADTVAIPLFEGEDAPPQAPPELAALLASGEARRSLKALAVTHAQGKRWLAVGLGSRSDFTPEQARVAAATALDRAREISTRTLCWYAPADVDPGVPAALVEGTVLADYRFEAYKTDATSGGGGGADAKSGAKSSGGTGAEQNAGTEQNAGAEQNAGTKQNAGEEPPKSLQRLIVSAPWAQEAQKLERTVSEAGLIAQSVNDARDLQNRPGNDLTPSALAAHARSLAAQIDGLSVEVLGREGICDLGMGAFAAVAQGSEQEPALITLRYEHADARGPLLGFVGKAVTFDSGGISLKPGAKMAEMKFDMSGGAAVIQAVAAIARLQLPVKLLAVVGATENLPDGRAVKPGDIVTAANGRTIEVNNTDAEGRLVLADCLCHARSLGAQRLIDLATLTGAVIVALGSTHAGLIANDDELAERVDKAGRHSGEIVWRLPLHAEYDELIKGRYGDLNNAPEDRKAGTIVGAVFLSNFVGDTPWAHLDIAGSAWDLGRAYAPKSASGYGVRLLVELARAYAA